MGVMYKTLLFSCYLRYGDYTLYTAVLVHRIPLVPRLVMIVIVNVNVNAI
jgi:hypothetical protein